MTNTKGKNQCEKTIVPTLYGPEKNQERAPKSQQDHKAEGKSFNQAKRENTETLQKEYLRLWGVVGVKGGGGKKKT